MTMDEGKLYVLKNSIKKNVYCTELWINNETNETFEIEEMFRWGETTLRLTDSEYSEIMEDIKEGNPIVSSQYFLEDQSLDDGCSMDFYGYGNEELVERVEEMWDNGMYEAFENAGFYQEDAEVIYHGEVTLEEVKNEE